MAKSNYLNDTPAVDKYIHDLPSPTSEICELLRAIILDADSHIEEFIKWNAPAFFYKGEMKAFDPKEYKRDLAVLNTRQKNQILLIFPTGSKLNSNPDLNETNYEDGRRILSFKSKDDVLSQKNALRELILEWISLIE
jgi:hypothetical protein